METGSSMPHTQGLSNNPYPEPNQSTRTIYLKYLLVLTPIYFKYIVILFSHPPLGLPRGLFPVGLPANILKEHVTSSIVAICRAILIFYI